MPFSSFPALDVKTPEITPLADTLQKAQTLQTARLSDMIENYKLQSLQRADAQNQALTNLYRQIGPGLASGDPNALSQLAQVDPQGAIKMQGDQATNQAAQLKNASAKAEYIGNAANSVLQAPEAMRPLMYQRALADAKANGIDTSNLPQQYDPATVQGLAARAMSAKDAIDTHLRQQQQLETQRHDMATERQAGATLAETQRHNKAAEAASNPFGVGLGAGGAGAAPVAGGSGLTGQAFLDTLPPASQSEIKALAEGRMAFPTGFSVSKLQPLIQAVSQYDPTFDTTQYNARAKARADLTSGKSSQNIRALNTALGHLGQLGDQISGTTSTGGYPGATLVNAAGNFLSQSEGDPGITNYKQTASALASELTNVFRGTGGAEADVKRYIDQLSPNQSKAQKEAAVKNIVGLLKSRMDAIGERANMGMSTQPFIMSMLDPHAKDVLSKWGGDDNATGAPGSSGDAATDALLKKYGIP